MARTKTFRHQQFFLLAITLSVLAIAMFLLHQREQVQRSLSARIDNNRLVVYHVDKAREELNSIRREVLVRQLQRHTAADSNRPATAEAVNRIPANSVPIHVLRAHVRGLLSHRNSAAAHASLLRKFERQMAGLTLSEDRLELGASVDLDRLRRQIDGLILSTEQIEAVYGLDINSLSDQQARVSQRDTLALIVMTTMLVMISYFSIAWIMSRIRAMVDEQKQLTLKLEQKNAELERFTYTVSHDLKSPLVTIKNFIGMLRRDVREGDSHKSLQDIEHISAAADDMAGLLEGLLELGRVGHVVNPPQTGRLEVIVQKAIDQLRLIIEARGVAMELQPNLPEYWGDALRLQEVFQNLIENSVKFMGDQAAPLIRIGAHLEQDELICSVSDNGIGIDPAYAERVFNLFERLDQSIEGTGIGLSLVQRIVEAHGGRIWIDGDRSGPGCRIVFTLPVKPDDAAAAA